MRCGLLGISLLCSLLAMPALAHPRAASAPYSVVLLDESGRELRSFHHAGQTFVMGSYGTRYNIRIENRTGRRVEAVVSVDGRDAISGEVGDYVSERGYLIPAHGEVLIEGFRKSRHEVAAFRFTAPSQSYSARMGTPQNVGIIGVAFFPEQAVAVRRPHVSRRGRGHGDFGGVPHAGRRPAPAGEGASEGPADGAPRPPAAQSEPRAERSRSAAAGEAHASKPHVNNLGTEYGETRSSHVTEVPFRRQNHSHPSQLITVRYDDRAGLLARGIRVDPRPRPVVRSYPRAFPRSRFAPPPPY